jgi:hypothetical protein
MTDGWIGQGQESKEITKTHYIVKPALAPDSSGVLEQLGADPADHNRPADQQRRPPRAA